MTQRFWPGDRVFFAPNGPSDAGTVEDFDGEYYAVDWDDDKGGRMPESFDFAEFDLQSLV